MMAGERGPAAPPVPPEIREAMGAEPTAEQWRAIAMPLEPYVIVAGAGSGKTSVIAARVVYLALVATGRVAAEHAGVLPGSVLCLTFTNKATENLRQRIRKALATVELPEGEEPAILNYHGFAAQILERHGLLAGVEPSQRVLSAAQRTELCARVLDEMTFEHARATWQPTLIGNILALDDQMANHRVSPGQVIDSNERLVAELRGEKSDARVSAAALERIELARAVGRFQAMKREMGVLDYGDQIMLALDVAERFPQVAAEHRERFRAAVLDEYQDTNVAQAALIARVFGDGFPVAAVGDPDQNIYAWRGASLHNLQQFPAQFPRADGSRSEKLPLYTNFRSGASILAAADRIISPLPPEQRPDPDKELRPWPPNGEGSVEIVRHQDEWSEANGIAERILSLRAGGGPAPAWSTFAVLCRKSRLFVPIQQVFAEAGIPAEIVGLAGLVKVPEVVEVLAYARAVADPFASVSLARILLGPRYRVGFKDLARVAAWAKERNYALRARGLDLRDEEEGETPPFLFAEALEHLGEVEGASEEGLRRLEEFRAELATLRVEARRPVSEFLAEVVRRIGLLAELDASLDTATAIATKRNLSAFMDEVRAFAPLEGELTLQAFLDYVDLVEASEDSEWSPVQPSEDDSVKVMTIHQAKGLEFDTVFVPGLAKGLLPDVRVQQNPAEKGRSLDFHLRGDREVLPSFQGVLKTFWQALRDQALVEERRTCYVALTRARRRLFASGAHWYGGDEVQKPKELSVFLKELADWGEESGRAVVHRGGDPSEENPLVGYRERLVRDWPGPALREEPDALFPAGWRATAAHASRRPDALEALEASLPQPERAATRQRSVENRTLALHLLEREAAANLAPEPKMPATVSVGGLVEYARCPKRFYWSAIRPLPRFSGPAARVGTQVHAWIERRSSGQTSLLDLDDAPDLAPEELTGEPGRVERLQQNFLQSAYAELVPIYAERPFLLHVDGFVVSGRIDAVYGLPDGPWEIVDYKTGRQPDPGDLLAGLQLDLYALACAEIWGKRAEDLTLTYFYLSTGERVSRAADDVSRTRDRVAGALWRMSAGEFEATPGDHCRWCDFRPFCPPGQAFVAAKELSARGPAEGA